MATPATAAVTTTDVSRPPTIKVSVTSLRAYAKNRLEAAVAYPKVRLARRDFQLARADVTAWFTNPRLAELCEGRLVKRRYADPTAIRFELYAMDAEADGWEPPATWDEGTWFSSRDFDRALTACNQRGFYYHEAPSWQFYDRATRVGVQTLPTQFGMPPWESGSPLRLFLHWAYAAAGMRLTHAATLGLDGRGVLIAGPSGSGKSATTLIGLVNGLDSIGDDYVLVDIGARVTAYPVFTVVKQDPEGLRRAGIEMADPDAAEPNWRGKVELDAARHFPRGLADRMQIFALLIPEIARARRTTLEKATAREAALALAPSGVFQLPGDSSEGFRLLAGLVRLLPAYRVKLSEDPVDIADAIGLFLMGAGARAG